MTTLTLAYRSIQSRVKSAALPQINWKLLYVMGIAICLCLFVFYIFSINQLTQGTYLIQKHNKEISGLVKANRNIESNFAETDFLSQIHGNAQELGFEKTTKVKYIELLSEVELAKK